MKKRILLFTILALITFNLSAKENLTFKQNVFYLPTVQSLDFSEQSTSYSFHYSPVRLLDSDLLTSFFVDFFTDILVTACVVNNVIVSFDDYPYANSNKYIFFPDFSTSNSVGEPVANAQKKWFRGTVDTALFTIPKYDIVGSETKFECYLWKFFGPIFEYTSYSDFDLSSIDKEDLSIRDLYEEDGFFRLGGQIAIFQFNPISLLFSTSWIHGFTKSNNYFDSVSCGIVARSYPFDPVLLEWRLNFFDYFDYFIFESHFEFGVMINRFEIFGAWKSIIVDEKTYTDGFSLGLKVHF